LYDNSLLKRCARPLQRCTTAPPCDRDGQSSCLLRRPPKHICPDLYQRARFEMGVSRRGLPCVPGFVLTDYKSQSRTMEMVLLGLYGKRGGEEVDRSDIISLYIQMSRCQGLDKTRSNQPRTSGRPASGAAYVPGSDSRKRTPYTLLSLLMLADSIIEECRLRSFEAATWRFL
jgi:hypothetical protein